jgi:DNA primase
MRYSEEKIEEIRTAADIVEVISGFVHLRKAGRNFVGLCPFHQEKTPSFNVNIEKGFYRCFGCGKGGNVFTFLMEVEKISFIEAVQTLAQRYGIPLPEEERRSERSDETRDKLFEATSIAARFFFDSLYSAEGERAVQYLRGREWNDDTLRRFGIGYAPDSWDGLLRHASAKGVEEQTLEDAGLVIRNDAGRVYDRFRGRVIFPIISTRKKVLGFGARAMGDEQPKYLNSPETAIYSKSRVLYGFQMAMNAIRSMESVIIVEGYADTLSLVQAGIENVVATSGTALTPDQVKMLTRYTRLFYFLYDADSAGFNAMVRGVDIMIEQGCDPRIVRLPAGEDPDSFVRLRGREGVLREVAKAVSFVDFITARYKQEGKLDSPEGVTEAVRHIVSLLAKMNDPIRRGLYITHIAEKFSLYESVLYAELEKMRIPARRYVLPRVVPVAGNGSDAPAVQVGEVPLFERAFLEYLLNASADVISETLRFVHIEFFTDERIRSLLNLVLDQYVNEGKIDIARIGDQLGDDMAMSSIFASMLMPKQTPSSRWAELQTVHEPDQRRALLDAYKKILLELLDKRMSATRVMLREPGLDPALAHTILRTQQVMLSNCDAVKAAQSFEALPDLQSKESPDATVFCDEIEEA